MAIPTWSHNVAPAFPARAARARPQAIALSNGAEPAAAPAAASAKRKFTFKEKHALETLPKQMDALRKDIAAAQARLADATLYARDPAGFADLGAAAAAKETELNRLEDHWLELEMLREELGG